MSLAEFGKASRQSHQFTCKTTTCIQYSIYGFYVTWIKYINQSYAYQLTPLSSALSAIIVVQGWYGHHRAYSLAYIRFTATFGRPTTSHLLLPAQQLQLIRAAQLESSCQLDCGASLFARPTSLPGYRQLLHCSGPHVGAFSVSAGSIHTTRETTVEQSPESLSLDGPTLFRDKPSRTVEYFIGLI